MSSYRHYQYLADNFPKRIKKAKENKPVEKETVEITENKRIIIHKYNNCTLYLQQ